MKKQAEHPDELCLALETVYGEMAWFYLASEWYHYYESFCDGRYPVTEEARLTWKTLSGFLTELLEDGESDETLEARLAAFRASHIAHTETLFAYGDAFVLAEYRVNRCLAAWEAPDAAWDDEEEARRLLAHLFEPEDSVEVNRRIRDMLSQLPVRMMKTRFFDLIKEALFVYRDGEMQTAEEFARRLLTAAGIVPATEAPAFAALEEARVRLSGLAYEELTKEQTQALDTEIAEIGQQLETETDACFVVESIINCLYTIFLTGQRKATSEMAAGFVPLLTAVCSGFAHTEQGGNFVSLPEEQLAASFAATEGTWEGLEETRIRLEARFDALWEATKPAEGAMREAQAVRVRKEERLLSTSVFAAPEEETSEPASEAALAALFETVKAQITASFEGKAKAYVRAVMAAVLKELPVFFASPGEVMEYVLHSLRACKDTAEKAAAVGFYWSLYDEEA